MLGKILKIIINRFGSRLCGMLLKKKELTGYFFCKGIQLLEKVE